MIAPVPGHCIFVTFKPSKKEKLSYNYVFGYFVSVFLSFSLSVR